MVIFTKDHMDAETSITVVNLQLMGVLGGTAKKVKTGIIQVS